MNRVFFWLFLAAFFGLRALAETSLGAAQAEFAKADGKLNESWNAMKKRLSGDTFEELKSQQRAWVIYRDERAELAGKSDHMEGADPKKSPAYFRTAARLSEERAFWLAGLAKGNGGPLTGVWIDGAGGTIQIVEEPGRLLFDFDVVRGPSFSLGNLSGSASWNDPLAWFSDRGRAADKPETNVVFIRKYLRLDVVTANAQPYHGHRAYFDGRYFKVASLNAEEQAAVIKGGE